MAEINTIFAKEAVDQLVQVAKHMATIDSSINALKNTQGGAASAMKNYSDAQKQVEQASKDQVKAIEALDKQRQKGLEQMSKAEAKEREMADAINKEAKTIEELAKQNKALIDARNKVNTTTDQGKKKIDEINQKLDQNNKKIKENSSLLEQQKINIGNYGSALSGIGGKLLSFAGGLGIGLTAMQAFKAVLFSTREGMNAFKDLVAGGKEAFAFLARSIATVDFTNLIQGFKDAFAEGERYSQALRDIAAQQNL